MLARRTADSNMVSFASESPRDHRGGGPASPAEAGHYVLSEAGHYVFSEAGHCVLSEAAHYERSDDQRDEIGRWEANERPP